MIPEHCDVLELIYISIELPDRLREVEEALWQGVLLQAWIDLTANADGCTWRRRKRDLEEARADVIGWIGTEDFKQCIDMAGLDYDAVLERFRREALG